MQIVIQPNGFIKDVVPLSCTVSDTQFINEIVNHVSKWHFPSFSDTNSVKVVFPFVFKTRK
jgi:hypothetical protein